MQPAGLPGCAVCIPSDRAGVWQYKLIMWLQLPPFALSMSMILTTIIKGSSLRPICNKQTPGGNLENPRELFAEIYIAIASHFKAERGACMRFSHRNQIFAFSNVHNTGFERIIIILIFYSHSKPVHMLT